MATVIGKIVDENLARGMVINDETYRKMTQTGASAGKTDDKGRPVFVAHNWSHAENTPESIAAVRAELDALEKTEKEEKKAEEKK